MKMLSIYSFFIFPLAFAHGNIDSLRNAVKQADGIGKAYALTRLSATLMQDSSAAALSLARQAEDLYRKHQNDTGIASAYYHQARCYHLQGELGKSEEYLNKSLIISKRLGHSRQLALSENELEIVKSLNKSSAKRTADEPGEKENEDNNYVFHVLALLAGLYILWKVIQKVRNPKS